MFRCRHHNQADHTSSDARRERRRSKTSPTRGGPHWTASLSETTKPLQLHGLPKVARRDEMPHTP